MNHITYLLDRQALRATLARWRTLALFAAVVCFGLIFMLMGHKSHFFEKRHVALISVSGPIMSASDTLKLLKELEQNSHVAAAIVKLNSPGGSAAASEQIYHGLRSLAEKKPVVGVIETLAASGAYIAALGTDYIVAQETSLVGSIGVLFQTPNFEESLKKLGVSMEIVKSTPLKATPNMTAKSPPETERMLESLIADIYGWFKRLVVERRGLSYSQLALAANGGVFTGQQALDLNLVDVLGDQRQARAWLENAHHIYKTTPIRSYDTERHRSWSVLGTLLQWFAVLSGGYGNTSELLGSKITHDLASRGLMESGILALWAGYPSQSQ